METWFDLLPSELKREFEGHTLKDESLEGVKRLLRREIDVAIVTVKECERAAVLLVFGDSPTRAADRIEGNLHLWESKVARTKQSSLRIVTTLIADPGNVSCAVATQGLISTYNAKLILLVGIAAGPQEKVKLGDVVCPDRVYDYEHVRLEVAELFGLKLLVPRLRPRPRYERTELRFRAQIEIMDIGAIRREIAMYIASLEPHQKPQGLDLSFSPSLHRGTVAAGEKLIADGRLSRMYKRVDQQIRAGAQEDYGFASVGEFWGIPWCIFRGISDYGDRKKKDDWQTVAAISAAATAKLFLLKNFDQPLLRH
ncbi:MAG: hypothetical protein NT002_00515 [candidate division Zixibacteria bacterium]|nr:hypothetical protein [candidate division Zixibacteria bacterium]